MLNVIKSLSSARAKNAEHGDVQTFIERLLMEVAANNYRYFLQERLALGKPGSEVFCWPPLFANERQVSGLFAHALSSVCPVSRPEFGITRTTTRKDSLDSVEGEMKASSGRVDFLATYGRREVALELKRVRVSTFAEKLDWKVLLARWNSVDRQAQQSLNHMRESRLHFPYAVAIGLLVIRVGRMVSMKADIGKSRALAAERFHTIGPELHKLLKPDFLATYT